LTARKLLISIGLREAAPCKVLITQDLRPKYCK